MNNPHNLPPWRDDMSDGCSGAPLLSANPKARARCVRHDERYYYGGSWQDRLAADQEFRAGLIADGIARWRADAAYQMVRLFGGPNVRVRRVSWSFGGEVFAYTEGAPR